MMNRRLRLVGFCVIGCGISSLAGLCLMLAFDLPLFAALLAAVAPGVACWFSAELRDPSQLVKIGVYALIGWALTFALQPVISQDAASKAARIVELPLVGFEWHLVASVVSTLLAIVGAVFAPIADPKPVEA
ncbi:MAG: hypothetical protein AAFU85_27340 [Planctomycetota bacterium]